MNENPVNDKQIEYWNGIAGANWVALQEALDAASEEQREKARAALRKAFEPYCSDRGVALNSAAWIVTARAGAKA